MKYFKIIPSALIATAISLFVVSCDKETPSVAAPAVIPTGDANIQVFNGTVKALRNYVFVDNVKISGSGLAYPGVFPASAYSFRVVHGARTIIIKDTLITTTQTPITFSQNFEAGKSYTVFTYDTTTKGKQFTVQNNIVVPADTTCRLRFANVIYNTTPVANVDVYSIRKGLSSPIFSNVATNSVTEFIPYESGFVDTLLIYPTGTTSPLLLKAPMQVFTPTRSYTTVYNGSFKAAAKLLSTFATY